jgi:hypothetical protein
VATLVIVQSFSPQLITSGASGYLRQEFHELELLDEITKLRYEGRLPDHIQGNFRYPLIRAYQTWKGTNYVPEVTHPALKWSAQDSLPLLPVVTDTPWQIMKKENANKKEKKTGDTEMEDEVPEVHPGFVAVKGSVPVNSSKKRKIEDEINLSASIEKTKTAQMIMASNDSSSPFGLIWDGENYSCAYDALFTVLFEIWSSNPKVWTKRFKEINQHHLKSLFVCFKQYINGQTSFETARNNIRHGLHSQSPEKFAYGTKGTSVTTLTSVILAPNDSVAISSPECTNCEYSEPIMNDIFCIT